MPNVQTPFNHLSRRMEGVSESATLRLNARVGELKAQGVDVINLTAGEPDFSVPEAAKQAVREALDANRSKYTPAPGIPELRQAVADKTNAQQPSVAATTRWKGADVIVTNGGKQAIFNAMMVLLDEGDEVLIPAPYWVSYPAMVRICGATPRIVPTRFEDRFKLTPESLRAALTARTRMLLLNSPSNPTGSMYTRAEFQALAQVLEESPMGRQVIVLSDEIYDRIALGNIPFCSFLESAPSLRERVVTLNGMSKSAAMTGWRIGWSVAPQWITQAMITLQGQSTSNINSLAQWASLAALRLPESAFAEQVSRYRQRRDLCLEILQKSGKIKAMAPDGAFYVFAGIGGALKPGEDSIGFAERLLDGAKVAVVPGAPFGEPEFIRLSFATDEKTLAEGCRRLVDYLAHA